MEVHSGEKKEREREAERKIGRKERRKKARPLLIRGSKTKRKRESTALPSTTAGGLRFLWLGHGCGSWPCLQPGKPTLPPPQTAFTSSCFTRPWCTERKEPLAKSTDFCLVTLRRRFPSRGLPSQPQPFQLPWFVWQKREHVTLL